MENDFDTQNNKPKHFGFKHKLAAIIITPLLIITFLSIVSLQADISSRPKNFKFQHVLDKIARIFERHPVHQPTSISARNKMSPIEAAIDAYLLNTNEYPKTLNDLVTDPGLTGWAGPYLKESQKYDPWNNPYIYQIDPNNPNIYDLMSYGRDGKPGGEGYDEDIYND